MSVTSLDVFDTTIHKTNAWLNELGQELGWDDRHAAYLALRATLHALRDRLTVEEVAQEPSSRCSSAVSTTRAWVPPASR